MVEYFRILIYMFNLHLYNIFKIKNEKYFISSLRINNTLLSYNFHTEIFLSLIASKT